MKVFTTVFLIDETTIWTLEKKAKYEVKRLKWGTEEKDKAWRQEVY